METTFTVKSDVFLMTTLQNLAAKLIDSSQEQSKLHTLRAKRLMEPALIFGFCSVADESL